jgi:hypothetical protein
MAWCPVKRAQGQLQSYLYLLEEYHCYQLHITCPSHVLLSRIILYVNEILGIISVDFDLNRSTTDKIFCIRGSAIRLQESPLLRREALYTICIEFDIHMKLVRLITVFLNVKSA